MYDKGFVICFGGQSPGHLSSIPHVAPKARPHLRTCSSASVFRSIPLGPHPQDPEGRSWKKQGILTSLADFLWWSQPRVISPLAQPEVCFSPAWPWGLEHKDQAQGPVPNQPWLLALGAFPTWQVGGSSNQ